MKSRPVKILLAILALVVVVIGLLPFLINADTFRPMLQTQLSSALGRKVTLSHLSFSLLSGAIVANDIAVADDPAFSTSPFLAAKSLHIGVEVGPFLFHRQVRITNLAIASPSIQLIQGQHGVWNFSSIGGAAAAPESQQQSTMPNLTVGDLKITDGTATVSTLPATAKPFVYSKLNLTVQQFTFTKSFPFQLSASLPGDGSLTLSGAAGPLAQQNAADTPFHATLQLKHLDPVAAGIIEPSKGISMVADVDAQLTSDGNALTSTGKLQAAQLKLAPSGSPAPHPVIIDYTVADNLDARTGQVTDLAIHTGAVAVHITGSFQLTTQAILLNLHLAAPNLPIDQLEELLPVVGIHLPSGSSLRGGTLTANLAITGPATTPTLAGPVEIDNTLLAGFDLGSKIGGLNPFGNGSSNGGTAIQTLRTDVISSPQSNQFSNIFASAPSIGTATGSGTVFPSGALNFNLVAKLSSSSGVGALANQAANSVGGFLGGFLHKTVNSGVPLTITGTSSNPSIHANLGAMLK